MMTTQTFPIACDLRSIPADQRTEHLGAAEHLLTSLANETHELPNGYAFRFAAEHYARVTAFIGNERRCCPFYTFTLEVPPGGVALSLRITGPEGAKELLAANLLASPLAKERPAIVLDLVPAVEQDEACACCAPATASG